MTVGLLHGSKTNARENFLFSRLFKTSKFDLDQKLCCFYVRYVTDVEGRTVNRAQTAPYVIQKNTGGSKTYVLLFNGTYST